MKNQPCLKIVAFGMLCCLLVTNCHIRRHDFTSIARDSDTDRIVQQKKALKELTNDLVIKAGKISLFRFPYHGPFDDEALVCNGKQVPFLVFADRYEARAFLAPSYFDTNKEFMCDFIFTVSDDSIKHTHRLLVLKTVVRAFNYPQEKLNVDQKRVVLSKEDEASVKKERLLLDELFEKSAKTLLIRKPFLPPLSSKITSIYGTQRLFNNHHATQHLGTDYRAAIGTPIKAVNSGIVVFAGSLFYGGNTVIVDHGMGIFTTYSHLSQIFSKVDEQVTNETIVGLSGMTGRVNGPHLHWGVMVHGNWVDGDSLIEASRDLVDNP